MADLKAGHRAVVVTGASSGIGAACVELLRDEGFRVFAAVRSESAFGRWACESGRVTPLRVDLCDGAGIRAAAAVIESATEASGLWGIVNCAGIVVPGPLELLTDEDLRRQFEVNVFGPMALTRAVLDGVRKARGRIVNIGSINGLIPKPYIGAYCASKHALEALNAALRMELRPWGVQVVMIAPGSVRTAIWEKAAASMADLLDCAAPGRQVLYRDVLEALSRGASERAEQVKTDPRLIAEAVVRALSCRCPRARYLVGRDAVFQKRVLGALPIRLRDTFILRRLRTDAKEQS